jgi:hypothetical protein
MGADTRACVMWSAKVSGPLGTPWSVPMESALNAWVGVPACRRHPRAARDDGDFSVRCAGWPAPHRTSWPLSSDNTIPLQQLRALNRSKCYP